jgi:hypothetical protein
VVPVLLLPLSAAASVTARTGASSTSWFGRSHRRSGASTTARSSAPPRPSPIPITSTSSSTNYRWRLSLAGALPVEGHLHQATGWLNSPLLGPADLQGNALGTSTLPLLPHQTQVWGSRDRIYLVQASLPSR